MVMKVLIFQGVNPLSTTRRRWKCYGEVGDRNVAFRDTKTKQNEGNSAFLTTDESPGWCLRAAGAITQEQEPLTTNR